MRSLLALLFVVAVLGGAWFLSRSASDSGHGALPAAAPTERASGPDAAPGSVALEALRPDGVEESVAREVASAPREEPVVAPPRADAARLTGRVVDTLGNPIAGADVRTGVDRPTVGFEIMRDRRREHAGPRTRTGQDGRFALTVEQAGRAGVSIEAAGFVPFRRDVTLVAGLPQDLGDVALDRGVVLAGRVVDARGAAVEGAEIRRAHSANQTLIMIGGQPGIHVTETDAEGRFEVDKLAVGAWLLHVTSEEHPPESIEGKTLHAGERVDGLEVVLADGTTIEGRLVGAPTEKLDRMRVRARLGSERDVIGAVSPSRDPDRWADLEPDGGFVLRGLRPGEEYSVAARATEDGPFGGGGSRSEALVVPAGARGVELEYSRGGAVVFQVVDGATGAPLTDFDVSGGMSFPMPLRGEDGRRIRRHPEGRVRFENLHPSPGHPTASLTIRATGYEPVERSEIPVRAGEDTDLGVLRLEAIPTVTVLVTDRITGAPVEGAEVLLFPWREPAPGEERMTFRRTVSYFEDADGDGGESEVVVDGDTKRGRTDAAGVCVLSSIPGSTCRIRVNHEEHAPFASDALALPLEGRFEYGAELSGGGRVDVRVVDSAGAPVPGALVERRSDHENVVLAFGLRDNGLTARTDAAGLARFTRVPTGSQAFRIQSERPSGGAMIQFAGFEEDIDSEGWSEVAVAAGETSELTLLAPAKGELWGIVTEAGVPLAGARVRLVSGDETIGHLAGIMGGGPSARTDSAGRYSLADLEVDDHDLEISHPSRAMPIELPISILEGENKRNVELSVAMVEGRVVDEDGDPMRGLRVRAVRARPDEGDGRREVRMVFTIATDGDEGQTFFSTGDDGGAEAETDEDGRYQLRGVVPDVDLLVEVRGARFEVTRSESFQVDPDGVRSGIDVVMRQAGSVDVSVVSADGAPAGNALVEARFVGETDDAMEPKVGFAQSGSTKLTGLRPGPWEVQARRIGSEPDPDEPVPKQRVEVKPNETHGVTLRFP